MHKRQQRRCFGRIAYRMLGEQRAESNRFGAQFLSDDECARGG
jgi:hypothetical protein